MAIDIAGTGDDAKVQKPMMGLTFRAMVLSVVFCIIASYWIEWSEVVTFF